VVDFNGNAQAILSGIERILAEHSSPWLNKKQAAQHLCCHPNYLARLEREGRLKAYVLNAGKGYKSGTKRYRRIDLDSCLQAL
jgi:hypothetical protein